MSEVSKIIKLMYLKNGNQSLNKYQVKEVVALAKIEGSMMTEKQEQEFIREYLKDQI